MTVPTGLATLRDPSLLQGANYVAGLWVDGPTVSNVINPATALPIFEVSNADISLVEMAVANGLEAMRGWQRLLPLERGNILRNWAAIIRDHAVDLATIISVEQGKPFAESLGEIEYGAGFLDWFAAEGARFGASSPPSHRPDMSATNLMQPVGLSLAITPWNFPMAMIARKAGAALAAGCAMIVKPASETPLSANALAVLAWRAGVPAGVFQVVHGDPVTLSAALLERSEIRAVSFTGSTRVGRILLAQAAKTVKRCSMELGGNAPFIVFADADVDAAVEGCMAAKFATSGQDCLAANRIYVHDAVRDAFVEKLAQRVAELRVGDGMNSLTDIGPMTVPTAVANMAKMVKDACANGAKIRTSCAIESSQGYFVAPTLLTGVQDDMNIAREEIFGPILPVLRFSDLNDVIGRANNTEMGLAAYVYTQSLATAQIASQALEFGMIAVNTPSFTGPPLPFGGIKQSGLGREGSSMGIYEYLENKSISYGGLSTSSVAAQ